MMDLRQKDVQTYWRMDRHIGHPHEILLYPITTVWQGADPAHTAPEEAVYTVCHFTKHFVKQVHKKKKNK